MSSKKSNRINIKDAVFCLLTSDDSSGVTYDAVEEFAKAMTIDVQPAQATGVLYGDGAQQENIAKLTGIAVKFEANKVAIEKRAKILGHRYEHGVLIKDVSDEAPYIALGYKVEGTNGTAEYNWLLKGRCQEINQKVNQQTDKINFSTDNLTINFIARDYDGFVEFDADTANDEFTEEQAAAWFTEGPVSYPLPTT